MSCNEIGQPPANKTATFSRGDDWAILFVFKLSGQPVNLTGWTFTGVLKKTGQNDVTMATEINAAAGTVTFGLTDQQTATMVGGANQNDMAGRWVLNITGNDANGKTRRYLQATVYVLN